MTNPQLGLLPPPPRSGLDQHACCPAHDLTRDSATQLLQNAAFEAPSSRLVIRLTTFSTILLAVGCNLPQRLMANGWYSPGRAPCIRICVGPWWPQSRPPPQKPKDKSPPHPLLPGAQCERRQIRHQQGEAVDVKRRVLRVLFRCWHRL